MEYKCRRRRRRRRAMFSLIKIDVCFFSLAVRAMIY